MRRLHLTPFHFLYIVVLSLVLASMAHTVNAASPTPAPDYSSHYAALIAKARSSPIRLLVTLNLNTLPEKNLSSAAVQIQRSAIKTIQNRVLSNFDKASGAKYTLITAYQIFPILALEANSSTVQALVNSPDVLSIKEDIPVPPTDATSNAVIGATNAVAMGYDGNGWSIAVLDTGVQTDHPFLAGKIAAEACFSTTDAVQGSVSICPNGDSTSGNLPGQSGIGAGINCPISIFGCDHGTHVAGIAAGKHYTGGPSYDGVSPGANLISIQVFSKFTTTSVCGTSVLCILSYPSDQLAALQYVATTLAGTYPIAAVNMSLGDNSDNTSPCDSDPLKPAIDALRALNIATVIASGNNGFTNGISNPACISTAISVGATDNADSVAAFSNRASFMSLYAPGVGINSSVPFNSFETLSGTSMSAPHVAGAWAILRQHNPNATGSVTAILNALQTTGKSITDSGFIVSRIQVNSALGSVITVTPSPTWTPGGPTPTATASLTPSQTHTPSSTAGIPLLVTNLNDSGSGSLRDIIANAGPGSTISFQSGLSGTLTLTDGEIPIFTNILTITGPGARNLTISGGNQYRIFNIGSSASSVTISGLTLANGGPNGDGGAILTNGGNSLHLTEIAFVNNNAGIGQGGAITFNGGTNTIDACTFVGNQATDGGALRINLGSSVTITNSTFNRNVSTGSGGAIRNFGTLTVDFSTLAYNTAMMNGGDVDNGATATLTNSIFFGSTAMAGADIHGSFTSGNYNAFGILNDITIPTPSPTATSTSVATNSATATSTPTATNSPTATASTAPPGSNDIIADPMLGAFGNNGGDTDTFVPFNSVLVHRIPSGNCALTYDQRGILRPSSGFCTVGSVELANAITATPTASNTAGPSPTATATSTPTPTATATATLVPANGALFDSITGATTFGNDGGIPDTYIGAPFTVSAIPGQGQITGLDVALYSATAQAYNDVQLRVQFWNSFASGGTSVFSAPAGSVYTFDLGAHTYGANSVYVISGLTLPVPVNLTSTGSLGVAFNFKGDSGAGLIDTQNLTTALRAGQPAFAIGSSPLTGPNFGYYANNPNRQTTFNFDQSEFNAPQANTSVAMRLYGTLTLATLTATPSPTATATSTATATNTLTPARIDSIGIYRSGTFYLKLHNSTGFADNSVVFNPPGTNLPVVGDWIGGGYDTIGVFDKTTANFTLCTANVTAVCANIANQIRFTLGNPNDTPLAGRWQISATHTGAGVYRPSNGVLYLKNVLTTGFADNAMVMGVPGDEGIAGDWTGKGFDSPGIYRSGNISFYLSNQVTSGVVVADISLAYGAASDLPIAGDWIAQGHDGVGMFRPANGYVYLKNALTTGFADNAFFYGLAGDQPVAGHWQAVYPPNTSVPPAPVLIAKTAVSQSGGAIVPGDNRIGG